MDKNRIGRQVHEAERAAWALGWFASLLKGRRKNNERMEEGARCGLLALGISVKFEEDPEVRSPLPKEDSNAPA
tara:strand:- start:3396 stop:3617 length:222 start_codon:yes stop_codon:yes gene_type:complete